MEIVLFPWFMTISKIEVNLSLLTEIYWIYCNEMVYNFALLLEML